MPGPAWSVVLLIVLSSIAEMTTIHHYSQPLPEMRSPENLAFKLDLSNLYL
jgi:hypothetical protein